MNDIKQKSISQMTMTEIRQLNSRLETELDVEQLILQIKRNNGERWTTNAKPIVNVSTPISQMCPQYDEKIKDKTISQLTMDELQLLRDRLRDETNAQDKIFELKRVSGEEWDWEDRPVVSTNTPVDQLYHYGVAGMKWGVRKSRSGYIRPNATLSRRDLREQEFLDEPEKVYNRVYKKAALGIRKGTRLLNNDPTYKGKNFKVDSPLRTEYYKKYSELVEQQLNAAATSKTGIFSNNRLGMSPHRTLQMKFSFDYEKELRASYDIAKADTKKGVKEEKKVSKLAVKGGSALEILTKKIANLKHDDSDSDDTELIIDLITDSLGHIIGIDELVEDNEIAQSDINNLDDFLAHHGILGMKWGVRKKPEVSVKTRVKSKTIESEKKETKPKSEDYMESRTLRKKTSAGLSNTELKRLNERLNLEKQYKDLTKIDQQKGRNFLSDSVASGLKQTASTVVAASSLYAVKKMIEKSMGATAAAEMFPKKK